MKRATFFVLLFLVFSTVDGHSTCTQDSNGGQCVTYVRNQFGGDYSLMPALCPIDLSCGARFAWGNWDLGFGSGQIPAGNSIMILNQWPGLTTGHMGKVASARRNGNGSYEVIVNESNWDIDEKVDCGVIYTYYPDDHEVTRAGGSSRYPVLGFIYGEQFPVKFTDTNTVYLYSNNQLWPIANEFVYAYLGFRSDNCTTPTPDWSKVIEVSASKRGDFTIRSEVIGVGGLPPDRKISYRVTNANCYSVAIDSTKLYALTTENGQTKFNHIVDWDTYVALGYSENSTDIVDISYDLFEYYGEGNSINSSNVTVWISGASSFAGDSEELEFPDLVPVIYSPTNLRYSNLSSTSITLLWDKGLNADYTNLTWGVYQGSAKIATVSEKTYMVTGLSPNTTYTFKATAIGGGEESDFSNVLSVTTPESSVPPEGYTFSAFYTSEWVQPNSGTTEDGVAKDTFCRSDSNPFCVFTKLTDVINYGSIDLTWKWYSPDGQFRYTQDDMIAYEGNTWWIFREYDARDTALFGTWKVEVYEKTYNGDDPVYTLLDQHYFEYSPCLSAPANPSSSSIASSSLRINWEAASYATGYEVFRQDGDNWIPKGNVSTLYFDDSDLNSETAYVYRIFSTAGSYTSSAYVEVSVTTGSAPSGSIAAPTNLRIVAP